MTLASSLVQQGYREGNLIPVGQQPSAAQLAEGLTMLNNLLEGVFGFVLGVPLMDWLVPRPQRTANAADYPLYPGGNWDINQYSYQYPPNDARMVWNGTQQLVYMPEAPFDGARMAFVTSTGEASSAPPGTLTIDGNGFFIEGNQQYSPASGVTHRAWFYRADIATWMHAALVGAGDEFPFPDALDDYWVCALSIRLSPRYGKVIQDSTKARYTEMAATLKTRYHNEHPVDSGGRLIRGAFQSYNLNFGWWR